MVKAFEFPSARWIRESDTWAQSYGCELSASVRILTHGTARVIFVRGDHNACFRAYVEEPEHMTGGQCRDKKFFRIVSAALAAKTRIRRTENGMCLPFSSDFVIAAVGAIARRSCTRIAGPPHGEGVVMFVGHSNIMCGCGRAPLETAARVSGYEPPASAWTVAKVSAWSAVLSVR